MPLRPFQPTDPGCIELVFRFRLFGIPLAIVIWVCLDSGTAPDGAVLAAVTAAGDDWMRFDLMGVLSKDLTYLSVTGTDGSNEFGLQSTIDHGSGIIGGITVASVPSQLAQVVTLRTAKRGRNFRGRTFVPGLQIDGIVPDTQHFTTSVTDNVFTEYQAIDARMAAVAAKQVVVSRVLHGVRRTVCESNRVTGRSIDNEIETIRRRSASAHR